VPDAAAGSDCGVWAVEQLCFETDCAVVDQQSRYL